MKTMLNLFARALREAYPQPVKDALVLHALNQVYEKDRDTVMRRLHRQQRLALLRRVLSEAEDGSVAVVESGMDCDGVQYAGKVTFIKATLKEFHELEDDIARWADGPFALAVVRPSKARGIRYRSCDLVLEAFEDGHAHSIHPHAL